MVLVYGSRASYYSL